MAAIRAIKRKSGTSYEVRLHRGAEGTMSKSFSGDGARAKAKAWANAMEAKLDKGERVSRRSSTVKFTEACADFLADYRPKKGDISEREKLTIQSVNSDPVLKKYRVSNVTHEILQEYMDRMLKTPISEPLGKKKDHPYYNGSKQRFYAPSTVRKHFYQIKKILEWHSMREKYSLDANLFKSLDIPSPWEGKRERRLNAGEEGILEASAQQGYTNHREWLLIMRFTLETAARVQELLKAKWDDVNVQGRAWNIPKENVKTKTFRQIPLSLKALEILAELKTHKKEGEERLFPAWASTSTLSKGWRRLVVRSGIEDFTFHDLRHEAICRLFEKDRFSDLEIMTITGHTNPITLKGYMHLRPSRLATKMD